MTGLTKQQLTGLDETHLVEFAGGQRLNAQAADAFTLLQSDARAAGFELTIGSGYRSFVRQAIIWNAKASGQRPVLDDADQKVSMSDLSPRSQLLAIMRFSAIPGTSRHHWGTDMDVYDAAAVEPDYKLQLSAAEVASGGVFDALHLWLDQRMAAGQSHGFFRPYSTDCGGVAAERWHLSYAPVSMECAAGLTEEVLREAWHSAAEPLLLHEEIEQILPQLIARFVRVPAGWCPQLKPPY